MKSGTLWIFKKGGPLLFDNEHQTMITNPLEDQYIHSGDIVLLLDSGKTNTKVRVFAHGRVGHMSSTWFDALSQYSEQV